jgi:DNA-binding transcriptional LysR family regulator
VFADQRLQLEHDAHARADRGVAPGLEGALGGGHGGVDFIGGGKRHPRQHLLGGRVDDVAPLGGLGLDPLAVDQQLDLFDLGLVGVAVRSSASPWNYCRNEDATPGWTRGGVWGCFEYRCANIQEEQKNRIIMQKDLTSLSALNWDDLKFFLEVARTRKASSAAKRLAVDYTTVSRRISSLEGALGTLLFEKSRTNGFVLTAEGQRLLGYAESIESTLHMACEQVSGSGVALSGHVRMGCTEGFGSFFVTPQLSHFVDAYPAISVDILPLPHFISLSKREADIVIALERPEHGPYVCCKLCDYRLRLYAPRTTWTATRRSAGERPGEASVHQLRRRPGVQLGAAVPGQPDPQCQRAPAQHQRDRAVHGGVAGARAGDSAVLPGGAGPALGDGVAGGDRGDAAVLDVLPGGFAQAQADYPVVGLHP